MALDSFFPKTLVSKWIHISNKEILISRTITGRKSRDPMIRNGFGTWHKSKGKKNRLVIGFGIKTEIEKFYLNYTNPEIVIKGRFIGMKGVFETI